MTSEAVFVLLFSIATGVAIATRHLKVPYTVALVLAGLTLGAFDLIQPPHLTRELLFAVFLPGLLFDAAFHIDAREFWRNRLAVGALAVPGVVAGTIITGLIVTAMIGGLELVEGFRWQHGLVFGALVAATDPIAVVSLFRDLNAPHRLGVLVEGESLLNDGTSIVALTLILGIVMGASTSAADVAGQFLSIVGGGALIGGVLGFGLSHVTSKIEDPMIEITLTTIAAYGSFVLAEEFHYSGVIATVTTGIICGNYGRNTGMSPSTQLSVHAFWEYLAFALNSVIFLLIGFDVAVGDLLLYWKIIVVAFAAMLAARAAVIFGVFALLRRTHESMSAAWAAALTWSGLRGALSMVLALALPAALTGRNLLVAMTFGVVLASILVQGLTMPFVLRRLGVVNDEEAREEYDLARGRLQVSTRLRAEVDRMRQMNAAPPDVLDALAAAYGARHDAARDELRSMHRERDDLREEAASSAIEHLLRLEKAELSDRLRRGLISRDAYDTMSRDADERLMHLRRRSFSTVEEVLDFAAGSLSGRPEESQPDIPR